MVEEGVLVGKRLNGLEVEGVCVSNDQPVEREERLVTIVVSTSRDGGGDEVGIGVVDLNDSDLIDGKEGTEVARDEGSSFGFRGCLFGKKTERQTSSLAQVGKKRLRLKSSPWRRG